MSLGIVRLKPSKKNYVWSGNELSFLFHKGRKNERIAETWELSFLDEGLTIIESGKYKNQELKKVVNPADLGKNIAKHSYFPFLIKFIDAGENLSVQVHPNDDYALEHEHSLGKTEMWYVLKAKPHSGLYVGLKKDSTKEELAESIKDGSILNLLNFFEVKEGDVYFIPSGTIHAIGKGVMVAEIQQSSNITYRLYDYNRLGLDGKPRQLHVEKALDVVDVNAYKKVTFPDCIGESNYFKTYHYLIKDEELLRTFKESFACVNFIKGEGKISRFKARQGDSFFVPANKKYKISGNCEVLITVIP